MKRTIVAVALLAVLPLSACAGSSSDETSTTPTEGPAIPQVMTSPGSETPSPGPTTQTPSLTEEEPPEGTEAELWLLPAEADGWVYQTTDAVGVYRYSNDQTACHATYTESPLDAEITDLSVQESLDGVRADVEEFIGPAEAYAVTPLRFADPEAPLTFETIGIAYPSNFGEDYVLVTSEHRTATHQLTGAVACPVAGWEAGLAEPTVEFIQRGRFDPSLN